MIDDAEKAKKLAQAICADIALYNGEVKNAPLAQRAGLIAAPIEEGRALFASRVAPSLGWILDEAIASILTPMLGVEVKSRPPLAQATAIPALAQPVSESGGSKTWVVVVAIGVIAAAAAVFLLRGH